MTTPLEKIVLGLLLVVLLSYRRRFRPPLRIRYIRLTMWYPEPTLTCISYSTTCPITFTWMTCVSLPVVVARLAQLQQLLRLLPQPLLQLLRLQQRLPLQLQLRHPLQLLRHPRPGRRRHQGRLRRRGLARREVIASVKTVTPKAFVRQLSKAFANSRFTKSKCAVT